MTTSSGGPDRETLKRQLYTGVSKEPAGVSLADLALLAARCRFDRRNRPASAEIPGIGSGDHLVPDGMRTLLVRLCSAKAPNDTIGLAVVDALQCSGLEPHPFDFFRMEEFVVRYAARLGRAAQEWTRLVRPAKTVEQPYDELVSEENLASAGRTGKLAFLTALRRRNPAKARALIEQLFPNESAAGRNELLDLLLNDLGEADIPFLVSLEADRAQTVRTKATALLGRIRGTGAYEARLLKLRDYLKVKSSMLGLRKSLAVSGIDGHAAIFELLDGLCLADVARTFSMTLEEFLAAAAQSKEIGQISLRMLIAERLFDHLHLLQEFRDTIYGDASLLERALRSASLEQRKAIIDICIAPRSWIAMPAVFHLEQIYRAFGGPLPPEQAADLLGCAGWSSLRDLAAEHRAPHQIASINAVAPLIPKPLSQRFIDEAARLSPRAADFHRFILALPERVT